MATTPAAALTEDFLDRPVIAKPLIPLSIPDLRGREADYLAQCVADNWVSSAGPFVTQFEGRVAALCGRAFGVATVNGTAALQLALIAVGVRPGDRVAVPDWTFAATANAVIHAGAEPYFVDVTDSSWTIDPKPLTAALDAGGRQRISAVIAVHSLGHPADMDVLCDICAAYGVPLIEDAAGAIGARYKGRPAGGLADAAIFSFNGNKTVTAGGGGMIVTDREDWADRARHLSTQARTGTDYVHDEAGFNFRMTNLNAAVGLAQLERLDEMVAAKRRIARRYDEALTDRKDLRPMPRADWAEHNCWLYSVLAGGAADARHLVDHLGGRVIQARLFWRSLSDQKPFSGAPARLTGTSAMLSGRVLSLPCSSGLADDAQDQVIAALYDWRGTEAA